MTDSTVTADREQLFAKLAHPATTDKFFERVSDSVSWTVMGTHPLAGTYHRCRGGSEVSRRCA